MIAKLMTALKYFLALLPFILFCLWNMKVNLKKEIRSKQIFMPIFALIYCIVILILMSKISGLVGKFLLAIPNYLTKLAEWCADGKLSSVLAKLKEPILKLAEFLRSGMERIGITYILFFVLNALFMLAHIILKRIIITFLKGFCKPGAALYEKAAGIFYEHDPSSENMFVKKHFGQARTFLKTSYIAALVISSLAFAAAFILYRKGLLFTAFYPVFGLILIGELFFVLDGLTMEELAEEFEEEETTRGEGVDFRNLRPALSRLFGDKLNAEDTLPTTDNGRVQSNDELLSDLETSDDRMLEAYGKFMKHKAQAGMEIDQSYLNSGRELLEGRSILFNDPFYYDLVPYIFYPMNRALLMHQKVLVILGRHKTEQDIEKWCTDGLCAVTNIPTMWNIGVLGEEPSELDVGIITRSSVHDLKLHEANKAFFADVGFVVLIEPSRLVTTAQVGLNSIVRYCRLHEQPITYCSMDKNCDGLVDALSHILMTSLTEVSATKRHAGISSYMCWTPDEAYVQHRMLPNISRYLGFGTELSFEGLKNRVAHADWYGGDAFPVSDIRWIAKQYYYPLLKYAERPTVQEGIDEYFRVSPNMWNAKVEDDHYMTVEDEAYNMFEVRRAFSTRAKKQGFINIITPEYLLKDYMAENESIFSTDPKAIPYIVADYAHTLRNVVLRLCLRMCVGEVTEKDIERELLLIGGDVARPVEGVWHGLCSCYTSGEIPRDEEGRELLSIETEGKRFSFTSDVITVKRKYSVDTGAMENMYSISDSDFASAVIGDLQSAGYIAEDENGDKQYIGTELLGHIFQKYLPGQFFTFDGKYYEMLRVTADGQVMVRRAADHITGRPDYRQVRYYTLTSVRDSEVMGEKRDIAGLRVTRQYADIRIKTPAYWDMPIYNDFEKGKKITVNGIPDRIYRNKQVLRIDFPESENATPEVMNTLTILFNEIFRTLFAENQCYICAVNPGEAQAPMTYSLECEEASANCIYVIEDSQLDIGLLEAVDRNLKRILAIACDYLDWHLDALDRSQNPPAEPEPPEFGVDPNAPAEKGPKKGVFGKIAEFFKKVFGGIGGFFKKLFGGIAKFFKKLFGGKRKKGEPTDEAGPERSGEAETDAVPTEVPEGVEAGFAAEPGDEEPMAEAEGFEDEFEGEPEDELEDELEDPDEADPEAVDASEEEPPSGGADSGAEGVSLIMMNSSKRIVLRDEDGEGIPADDADDDIPDIPVKGIEVDGDSIEFEPERVERPGEAIVRKPYHQRYYLLYGGSEVPSILDPSGTLELLKQLGLGNGELKQARDGRSIADMIERTFVPNKAGTHYCDFCGAELIGGEYERLVDGRERCLSCGKTSIKSLKEFNELYQEVHRNLETFFCAPVNARIKVQMVNAKKLHKKLNQRFIPTDNSDGRVLGVAIMDGNKNYSILIENGAPRLKSIMTMAHELTHIWQYLNWDRKQILKRYGKEMELEIYEGMAKWVEIQYTYLIGEPATAKREEIITRIRDDEYGHGFLKYAQVYELSSDGSLFGKKTPFTDKDKPL